MTARLSRHRGIRLTVVAGNNRGREVITPLPRPGESTTPTATFTEANGVGTLVARGNGNGRGGVQLDYDFPQLDLTSGVSNTQFFLEFTSISRVPVQQQGETAINVSITVTDSAGNSGTYGTGLANVAPFNVVLNFDCTQWPTCFSGDADFTSITHITVLLLYPTNFDSVGSLTAVLDRIRTTPPGGVQPPPPTPQITAPTGNPVYARAGSTLDFGINFRSNGQPAPVVGFEAQDVVVGGTATGITNPTIVDGTSESDYVLRVGPLTGSGTITVRVPAGVAADGWAQQNLASSTTTINFVVATPPNITTVTLPTGRPGVGYDTTLTATRQPPPTWQVAAGTLPPGLSLSSAGRLSGTPTLAGTYNFTVRASNTVGTDTQSDTQDLTINILQAPAITSADTAAFTVDEAGSFTITTTGFPAPEISTTSTLPAGLDLSDNGDGTATLSGTPTEAGTTEVDLVATNDAGEDEQTLTIVVSEGPAFTSPAVAEAVVGDPFTFEVTTTGSPSPDITMSDGDLPPGLELTDNGDGTATIDGTPTGPGGVFTVELTAENSVGSVTQDLVITVDGVPSFISDDTATFTVSEAGTFTVETEGSPPATIAVTEGTLPAGLTMTSNPDVTATIAGTPTAPGGATEIELTATNRAGEDTQTLTTVVNEEPVITSADSATFVVGRPGSFEVTTTGFPEADLTVGDLPEGLSFDDNGDGTGVISGTPAGPAGTTQVDVTATNTAGEDDQTLTVVVNQLPRSTSPATAEFTVGTPGEFTVVTEATPIATILLGAIPLPDGLSLEDNGDGTATIAGTPTAPGGETVVQLIATNSAGSATLALRVVVNEAPAITSTGPVTFALGEQSSYEVTTRGFPNPALVVTNLPAGLIFTDGDDGTGTISGTPTGPAGTTTAQVTATNSVRSATQDLDIIVTTGPAITSSDEATFSVGEQSSFEITTSGVPAPDITIDSDLPSGLSFVDNGDGTATISGTPVAPGSLVAVTVRAVSDLGDATPQRLEITVEVPC